MRTVAVLPVKGFANAKRRLASGLSPEQRQTLAEAMFADVIAALRRTTLVDEVLVVTGGGRAHELAAQFEARVLPDHERGHNVAALIGVRAALEHDADRALLVPGDCPAIDPLELDQLLARPTARPSVLIVPDRHRTGTNALVLTPPGALAPSFGPGSCERHARAAMAAGVNPLVVDVPSLAIDVDTPEDLEALDALLGVTTMAAGATRRVLASLTAPSKC